ncbi:MAG: hypothetical protein SOT81_03135 [Treponema sp.]|nr:hypothetical protein [Treponema sp.]
MTTEKVNDLEVVDLSEYFDPRKFRLVPADASFLKGGISEIPVNFNFHPDFIKKLGFKINNLQTLYGFSIMGDRLKEMNKSPYYSPKRGGILKEAELNDAGELWILKFETFDGKISLFAAKEAQVLNLLNNCRIPTWPAEEA